MNSFNKVLISTVVALMTSEAQANDIHRSCLQLSDTTIGKGTVIYGVPVHFSNNAQLTKDYVSEDMRLYSFTTCENADGNITGLQFFLSESQYLEHPEDEQLVTLDPLGNMTGDCQTMTLQGHLDKIEASYNEENGVHGLRFYRDGKYKDYGKLSDDTVTWDFTDDQPLLGLYGNHNTKGIKKLGFITLDLACQADHNGNDEDQAVDDDKEASITQDETIKEEPASEEEQQDSETINDSNNNGESTETLNTVGSGQKENLEPAEQPDQDPSSYSLLTKLIVALGIVVFTALLALSIYKLVCKGSLFGAKGENVEQEAPTPVRRSEQNKIEEEKDIEKNVTPSATGEADNVI